MGIIGSSVHKLSGAEVKCVKMGFPSINWYAQQVSGINDSNTVLGPSTRIGELIVSIWRGTPARQLAKL